MNKFYSNGKLLLTGEYVVLDGAKSLAVPTKFGQDLVIKYIAEPQLIWESFTHTGKCWFKAVFDLPKLRLINCTFSSLEEGSTEFIAETLQDILMIAQKLNPKFLQTSKGFVAKTNLSFSRNWGLGSSSTLINNIASWAGIDAYKLIWNTFSGSAYDIACAQNNTPIFYQLEDKKQIVTGVNFNPDYIDELYFVHLNKKQNSEEEIAQYRNNNRNIEKEITVISTLSDEFLKAKSVKYLEKIIVEHETIISLIINKKPIKKQLFSDYFGEIKSLGAWGGDFVLVTGNKDTPKYFKEKGFKTVLPYKEMVVVA